MANNENDANTPKMLVYSDNLGCPEKTKKKNVYLSNILCRPTFYRSVNRFLNKNGDNKVSFVGNFFDKGQFVMSNIIEILKLKNTDDIKDRIHIVLSFREIHKLRFRFELDKVLLKKGIYKFPEKDDIEIKKVFIPIDLMLTDDFDTRRAKRYVNAVYQRIIDILTQTHDGKMSECILIHECLFKAFKNARRQGYLELMLLVQQLGAFVLVYPFLQDSRYITFLGKDELKLMIQFLVRNIKEYYDKYCKNDSDGFLRTDPIKKDLQKHLNNIYGIIEEATENYKTYQTDKLPPMDLWATLCNNFFNEGKLMIYDSKFKTLLCHDYALPDFFKVFRVGYALVVRGDNLTDLFQMKNEKSKINWAHALYYHKLNYFYDMYDYCYKLLEEKDDIKEIQKLLNEEKIKYHKKICEEDEREEVSLLLDFSNSFTGKDDEKLHDIEKNVDKCNELLAEEEVVVKEEEKKDTGNAIPEGENVPPTIAPLENTLPVNTPLENTLPVNAPLGNATGNATGNPVGNASLGNASSGNATGNILTGGANIAGSILEHFLNQKIEDIDLKEHSEVKFFSKLDTFIEFINEGLYSMVNADLTIMDETQMDLFLYIHTFYLRIFNNPKTFFTDIDKDEDYFDYLFGNSIECLVFGTVETGNAFPLVRELEIGEDNSGKNLLLLAPNITNTIYERMFTSFKDIQDNEESELDKYTLTLQKNYPIASIKLESDQPVIIIESLTKKGELSNDHTHLGEFMAHTFFDFYLTHDFINFDYATDGQVEANQELKAQKLTADMLPDFDCIDYDYGSGTFFINNMLFISLDTGIQIEGRNAHFLILYLNFKKDKDSYSNIYYYYGNINQWEGNFWDPKNYRLVTYKLTIDELIELNKFIAGKEIAEIRPPTIGAKIMVDQGIVMDNNEEKGASIGNDGYVSNEGGTKHTKKNTIKEPAAKKNAKSAAKSAANNGAGEEKEPTAKKNANKKGSNSSKKGSKKGSKGSKKGSNSSKKGSNSSKKGSKKGSKGSKKGGGISSRKKRKFN